MALKEKKLIKEINGKCNNIRNTGENKKNITVDPLFKNYKKTRR
jgi:hypothetical protein